ncbi:hypothetical protein B0H66DRAFT_155477 [Apodospora peruviana]|uniref:BZIP domain-containing protein n=1 Tax=Apodospora peruviana TaxID=516989 RepID=A0AAE0MBB7_9PEZI|nr:hypothetical protein B0H66DRAFT_155477 [Apodospora peruviana]
MAYQYPEDQDSTQIPTFGVFWADVGEAEVDYSAEALESHEAPAPPPSTSSRSSKSSSHRHKRKGSKAPQSGSDTEKESRPKMPSRSSRHHHSSSSSSSSKKDKASKSSKTRTDDWSEVTDPEERRRIQNKIAQRKFREKAREQKERTQRDALNQQYAGSSYRVPGPDDLPEDQGNLSGLPWGSVGMGVIMSRGHATASQQGGGRRESSDPAMIDANAYLSPYGGGYTQMSSWDGTTGGGSSGDETATTVAGGLGTYYASGTGSGDDGSSPYHYDYDYDNYEGGGDYGSAGGGGAYQSGGY